VIAIVRRRPDAVARHHGATSSSARLARSGSESAGGNVEGRQIRPRVWVVRRRSERAELAPDQRQALNCSLVVLARDGGLHMPGTS
jgi:hypothetical protein